MSGHNSQPFRTSQSQSSNSSWKKKGSKKWTMVSGSDSESNSSEEHETETSKKDLGLESSRSNNDHHPGTFTQPFFMNETQVKSRKTGNFSDSNNTSTSTLLPKTLDSFSLSSEPMGSTLQNKDEDREQFEDLGIDFGSSSQVLSSGPDYLENEDNDRKVMEALAILDDPDLDLLHKNRFSKRLKNKTFRSSSLPQYQTSDMDNKLKSSGQTKKDDHKLKNTDLDNKKPFDLDIFFSHKKSKARASGTALDNDNNAYEDWSSDEDISISLLSSDPLLAYETTKYKNCKILARGDLRRYPKKLDFDEFKNRVRGEFETIKKLILKGQHECSNNYVAENERSFTDTKNASSFMVLPYFEDVVKQKVLNQLRHMLFNRESSQEKKLETIHETQIYSHFRYGRSLKVENIVDLNLSSDPGYYGPKGHHIVTQILLDNDEIMNILYDLAKSIKNVNWTPKLGEDGGDDNSTNFDSISDSNPKVLAKNGHRKAKETRITDNLPPRLWWLDILQVPNYVSFVLVPEVLTRLIQLDRNELRLTELEENRVKSETDPLHSILTPSAPSSSPIRRKRMSIQKMKSNTDSSSSSQSQDTSQTSPKLVSSSSKNLDIILKIQKEFGKDIKPTTLDEARKILEYSTKYGNIRFPDMSQQKLIEYWADLDEQQRLYQIERKQDEKDLELQLKIENEIKVKKQQQLDLEKKAEAQRLKKLNKEMVKKKTGTINFSKVQKSSLHNADSPILGTSAGSKNTSLNRSYPSSASRIDKQLNLEEDHSFSFESDDNTNDADDEQISQKTPVSKSKHYSQNVIDTQYSNSSSPSLVIATQLDTLSPPPGVVCDSHKNLDIKPTDSSFYASALKTPVKTSRKRKPLRRMKEPKQASKKPCIQDFGNVESSAGTTGSDCTTFSKTANIAKDENRYFLENTKSSSLSKSSNRDVGQRLRSTSLKPDTSMTKIKRFGPERHKALKTPKQTTLGAFNNKKKNTAQNNSEFDDDDEDIFSQL